MRTILYTKIIFSLLIVCGLLISAKSFAQVTVISKSVNAFWVTPEALMRVGLMNSGSQQKIILQGRLYNSSNELLMRVVSFPFDIPQGVTRDAAIQISVNEFNSINQAEYIRVNHVLPSGKYSICYSIMAEQAESTLYDNCDEIVSEFNSNIYLVSPYDEEIIDTKYPLLVWHHTEPFDVLNSGEFFRILVVEKQREQSAGSAITTNIPLFIKDFLLTHQVPYSIDAIPLEEGKQYAWEVQKISQGAIIQKTETWSFSIRKKDEDQNIKYVTLSKTLDAGFYTAKNNKVFFRFDEEYNNENVKFEVFDSKNNSIEAVPVNEMNNSSDGFITHGYHRFELDLNKFHLSRGIYFLQVVNQKKEVYKLKFYIE